MQAYTQFISSPMTPSKIILFAIIVLWTIFWKGLALWHSVKRNEKKWFVALLVLNTFSILELIYLFYVVKIKSIRLD